jgi:hypothetical protein
MDGQDVSGSDDVPSSTDTIMRSQDDSSALENPQIAQNPAASLSTRGHQVWCGDFITRQVILTAFLPILADKQYQRNASDSRADAALPWFDALHATACNV